MFGNCPTCKRLWEEFSEATKAHLAILSKIQIAQIEQNSSVLKELEPLNTSAVERRCKARMAVKEHEATHQSEKVKGQSA
jgi:hypothetical protein